MMETRAAFVTVYEVTEQTLAKFLSVYLGISKW